MLKLHNRSPTSHLMNIRPNRKPHKSLPSSSPPSSMTVSAMSYVDGMDFVMELRGAVEEPSFGVRAVGFAASEARVQVKGTQCRGSGMPAAN